MDLVKEIKSGKIFVYPTDTIYGIGCDAGNSKAVNLIKKLKKRDISKPMSVIAPSISWIKKHCVVDNQLIEKYLPGHYTLILKKKNSKFLSCVSDNGFLGVRIPNCKFAKVISKARVPFITTSVNFSGEPFAVNIEDIDKKILQGVDIVINDGRLDGSPSVIVENGREISR